MRLAEVSVTLGEGHHHSVFEMTALVFIGSNVGSMAGEAANDLYQEELPVFMHWAND